MNNVAMVIGYGVMGVFVLDLMEMYNTTPGDVITFILEAAREYTDR